MSLNAVNQTTGSTTQIAGLFETSGGVNSIAVNGVSQTISMGSVDLDVASNLIPESQWTEIQALLV